MRDNPDTFSITRSAERTFRLTGDMDLSAAPEVTRALQEVVGTEGDVLLDVEELSFIDSSGIRALLRAARTLDGRGRLVLQNTSAALRRVLQLLGLDAETEWIVLMPSASSRRANR